VEDVGREEESGDDAVKELAHALRTHGADTRTRTTDVVLADLLHSPGVPLDAETRAFFEPRFGRDLSNVRVHNDGASTFVATQLRANAFTVGNHIILGEPSRRLLAHELAHVVQQRNVVAWPNDRVVIGHPGDAFEENADASARAVMSGRPAPPPLHATTPRVQGSFFGTLFDFIIFPIGIYRLFGGEYYWASTLKDYMKSIEKNKKPEDAYDSDNKARACIKREKELGPSYSLDLRVLLVSELLGGWTSNSDEKAIITLLRNHPNDIQDVVKRIGRPRIWDDFSGDNLAVLKALTMTKDEATDALVDQMRKWSDDQIAAFQRTTVVPELQESARKARALKRITAPVPSRATVDQRGSATITINGIEVTFAPDKVDPTLDRGGFTDVQFLQRTHRIDAPPGKDPTTIQAGAFTPPTLHVTITTNYPPGEARSKPSAYGAGSTLQSHEATHGQDWIDFFTANAPPQFRGTAAMNLVDFNAEIDKWSAAVDVYRQNGVRNTVGKTDCTGILARDEDLVQTGFTCRTVHGGAP